jgi:hypothetical protein
MYFALMESANITSIAGTAFTVVGSIGILQRKRRRRAWIFVVVYIIGWIWQYTLSFVILPEIIAIEGIDYIIILNIIFNIYEYSMILISLYA